MTEALRRNPLIVALAVMCLALAAVVGLELATLGGEPTTVAPGKVVPPEAKLLPHVAALGPEAAYPETAARPLWIPTRRPAPTPLAAQPSFARGQFVLQGVTIAGDTRIALIKEKASGRIHRVEKGRDVNGLQLAEVEPERVTLAQGGEREVLELLVQRPGAAGAGPASVAPAAAAAAATGGPFSASSPAAPSTGQVPGAAAAAAQGRGVSAGPLSPGGAPAPVAPAAVVANPAAGTLPQQQPAAAPMTPEELLARRRARRTQSP